jgi:catechol 2,3-dioxygenase-like lactoylglutathione lyase family enzyme
MKILGLDHVQLAMPAGEEARAREFYVEVLGLHEIPKPTELAKRGGAWFENDRVKIHLGVEADFRPARKAHPGLLVKDLRALIEDLRTHGYAVTEDAGIEGVFRAFVADPFGNRIELIEAPTQL